MMQKLSTRRRVRHSGCAAIVLAGLVAATSTPVQAADLGGGPAREPVYYDGPRLSLERWTGFYLGGTLGGGFGDARARGDLGDTRFGQNGWIGTIHAGYNWQLGRAAVIGLEADLGSGNVGGTLRGGGNALSTDLNAIGSLRARAGLLVTPALLIYATGGIAWADMEFKLAGGSKENDWLRGHQIGAGAELKLSQNWSTRVEYIFTDLHGRDVQLNGLSTRINPDFHTVRAGFSFKF